MQAVGEMSGGYGHNRGVPELPEVESLAGFLRERAVERAFVRADITAISALKTYDPPISSLVGLLIDDVQRHGKFLDISAQGIHLVIHLARAGWLRWREEQSTALVRPGKGPIALRVTLDDGSGFDLTEAGHAEEARRVRRARRGGGSRHRRDSGRIRSRCPSRTSATS